MKVSGAGDLATEANLMSDSFLKDLIFEFLIYLNLFIATYTYENMLLMNDIGTCLLLGYMRLNSL